MRNPSQPGWAPGGPGAGRAPPKLAAALAGGGEMGARVRALDWSTTPVGPPARWPSGLADGVAQLLCSKTPTVLFWGPEFIAFYNDAYAPAIGTKHPRAFGRRARDQGGELWDGWEPMLSGVVGTGQPYRAGDLPLRLNRRGYLEQTYADVACDPVRGEDGTVGGVVCTVTETTGRVLSERRLGTLSELGLRLADAADERELCDAAMTVLDAGHPDIPFAALYHSDSRSGETTVIGSVGVPDGDVVPRARLGAGAASVLDGTVAYGLAGRAAAAEFVSAPPRTAAASAVVLPVSVGGKPVGALVAGVNRYLALDHAYRDFLDLVAVHVSRAFGNLRGRAEERARAAGLAALDQERTTFFADVSHEFRTPLTLILGPVQEALADPALPAAQRQPLVLMHRNALRLRKLVDTMLDFSARAGDASVAGPAVGADDYLVKSFSAQELVARVRANVELSRLRGQIVGQLRGLADAAVALAAAGSTQEVLAVAAEHAGRLVGVGRVLITGPGGRYQVNGDRVDVDSEPPATVVPLRGSSGEAHGELRFWPDPDGGSAATLPEVDQTVLAQLGRLIALRLENTRLYEAEHRIAATLQHSLLPQALPRVPGARIASRYRAGSREAEVGGDWYDAVVAPDGQLVLVIGDVVGKGVLAAAAMGQIRNALRAYILEGFEPGEALARLNRLARTLDGQTFATVACLRFDPAARGVRLSSAGHPPPLAIEPGGRVRFLHRQALGPPIGAVADVTFRTEEAELDLGGRILLYTDGLVEDRLAGMDAGLSRLLDDAAAPTADLDELLDLLIARVAGRAPRDDVALLALEAAEVNRLDLRLPADPTQLSGLRHRLQTFLLAHGVPEADASDLMVAVSKAAANAIEHPVAPTHMMISVEVTVQPDEVLAIVRDTGRWRPSSDSRQRGRGLSLIGVLTELSVDRGRRGTTVRLRRRLSGG